MAWETHDFGNRVAVDIDDHGHNDPNRAHIVRIVAPGFSVGDLNRVQSFEVPDRAEADEALIAFRIFADGLQMAGQHVPLEPVVIEAVRCAGEHVADTIDDARVSTTWFPDTKTATVGIELPEGCDQVDMTPDQARRMARALLAKAAMAEDAMMAKG